MAEPLDNNDSEKSSLFNVGIVAGFVVLAFIGTKVITIPVPGTGGYFNLGDTFVMISALLFGPWVGMAVGAIGPSLADAFGYLPYAPATFVIKGLEGLAVGALARRGKTKWVIFGLALGTVIIAGGYFVVQGYIYVMLGRSVPFFNITTFGGAVAELPFNVLQGILSGLVAFGVWSAFGRGSRKT